MTGSVTAGRAAFGRRAWRDAYDQLAAAGRDDRLGSDDLERLATAAYLIGADDAADRWVAAHDRCLRDGDVARAVRCAFWLAYGLLDRGEVGRAGGWLAKAADLLGEHRVEGAERGYLIIPQAIEVADHQPAAALELFDTARRIGERFADVGLITLGLMGQGQTLISLGRWSDAVRSLDEAMVAVARDDVPPMVSGIVLCGAIDACRRIFDLRRTVEWTAALTRWCDPQPDLVPFRGQCLVHRVEIMRLRGDWPDAMDEADLACRLLAGRAAHGDALYETGELHRLRGEGAEAEAAYRAASQAGRDPQPGLALLRLAQRDVDAAVAAIRRLRDEASDPAARARMLGPFVEIALQAGDVAGARDAADELGALAEVMSTAYLDAAAAHASGSVRLAEGDPQAALRQLRRAWGAWRALDVPYAAARTRELIGLACTALGDREGGEMELDAARLGFRLLGAAADTARVEDLLVAGRTHGHGLTVREREVVALVAQGRTNREIAATLVISEHTVARHVQNVFGKLGVASRTALCFFAYEHGLV
jgi:DNA-binding CsgD family transcriptional regulator